MGAQPIYQFYSELSDSKPKIWRRFQVTANISLAKLGYIIMTLYEMKANHLFSVDYPVQANLSLHYTDTDLVPVSQDETYYHFEIPTGESFPENQFRKIMDATGMTLHRLSNDPGLQLSLLYDTGDGWEVHLTLESVFMDRQLPARELPRVLEGEGFGIIEDCGGVGGLQHLSRVFKKKSGKEYRELSEWLGCEDLDLSAFDLDDMNFRLKKVPRIYQELYEFDYAPTPRSIGILERKYLKKKNRSAPSKISR